MRDFSATPEMRLPQPELFATRHLRLATVLNVLLAVLLPGCLLPSALAQTETATIAGRVSDPSGAIIPGAILQLVNIDKGTETETKTNGSGLYVIPAVQPGRYRIEVKHDGFKVANLTGLTVNVQDNLEENFKLEVGSISESVTVNGEGLQMNTTDGSVSTVIDRNFVANIPLNGRSFQDLIDLTPGVSTQSPQVQSTNVGVSGDFSVNGQRAESNSYILDGVSANTTAGNGAYGPTSAATGGSLGASTALGTTQSLLSVDALQEFRVESSTYSAEYGTSPGGQFSLVSRSGTRSLHGSVYDYLRNNFFDANDWFNDYNQIAQPALRQNDFGGTLGGPIWIPRLYDGREKSFFFVSYEGLRLDQPTEASLQYVPSDSLRAAGASVLRPILNAFPLPTGPEIQIACDDVTYQCPTGQPLGTEVPSGLAPNILAYSLPSRIDSTSVRFDYLTGPKVHTFLRAAYTPSETDQRSQPGGALNVSTSTQQSYTVGIDTQLSSAINDQFRIGYSRAIAKFNAQLDAFGGSTPVNLADAQGNPGFAAADSVFISFAGIGYTGVATQNTADYSQQWDITNAMTWTRGRHSIKAGVDYRRITSPYASSDPVVDSEFDSPASIVTGNVDSLTIGRTQAARPLYNEFALFGQDEFRVTRALNISLGLRWEVDPPPQSDNAVKPYPLLGDPANPSGLTVGLPGSYLYRTTWNNIAPRLGVAWKAHSAPGNETVVRAGVGIFYDTGYSSSGFAFVDGLGVSNYLTTSDAAIPVTPAQLQLSLTPVAPYGNSIWAINRNLRLPYAIQWNGAIEQAIGKHQTLTVSYVAANGRRLVRQNVLLGGSLNPAFAGGLIVIQNGSTSNYQALQLQFHRQVSHGFQALASYTWAHSIDYGSEDGGWGYKRGNSDFDLRDNFNAGLTWDTPAPRGSNALSRVVLDGWGIDGRVFARTAFPVALDGNVFINPVSGAVSYLGLNVVPATPIYTHSSLLPGRREINANAFVNAPNNTVGNAPRNFVRGFPEAQLNLAVRRDFPLLRESRLQFRAETFNILNHPAFGYIDPNLGDATFGQALSTLASSLPTLSALYQQGGARSMQFTLKVVF